jgi:hypothetical protein
VHYYFGEINTLGDLLSVLATQPDGDVWLEDEKGVNHRPGDLLGALEPRHLKLPFTLTISGGGSFECKIADGPWLAVRWSQTRQGFMILKDEPRSVLHYFGPAELWPSDHRPDIWPGNLLSLCRRYTICNSEPIIYPDLDDPMICRNCLKRIRESQ